MALKLLLVIVCLLSLVNCEMMETQVNYDFHLGENATELIARQCRSQEDVLTNDRDDTKLCLSCRMFYQLCSTVHTTNISNYTVNEITITEAYGYGFIMILAVSLLSLLGIFLVPFLSNSHRVGRIACKYILTLLTAMGVSALLCDVLFELIPTLFHVDHDGPAIEHSSEIWRGSGIVGGIFIFYLLELILHSVIDTASQKTVQHKDKSTKEDNKPLMSELDMKIEAHPCVRDYDTTSCRKVFSVKHVRPLAWIILIGDLVHNIADGITLGVAVSQSLSLGLSTTFAICLHEVPHELADFGILIKSGMHWLTALFFNFLSSLSAFIGFFVGVAISTNSVALKEWLLAIAAGSFLYIALADLLPELRLNSHSHDDNLDTQLFHSSWHEKIFHGFIVLIGFFIAFTILLIVSLHEENLNKLFQ